MKEKAGALIGRFEVDIDLERPVGELRVSEQGIVAICKAIASEGRVLLIDEASAPLDNTERQTLYRILEQLRDEGKGIMYISHHLEEIFRIGQRVTVLRNGQNVCTVPVGSIDYEGLIAAMTGREEALPAPPRRPEAGAPVRGVARCWSFRRGESPAPAARRSASSLRRGEILGIAGLEGSSKDEIARIIYGLSGLRRGRDAAAGNRFRPSDPLDAVRGGVGLVPTDRKNAGLVTCRSVAENIILRGHEQGRPVPGEPALGPPGGAGGHPAPGHQDLGARAAGGVPERRQPAEGAPLQVARSRGGPASPCRAHRGHRRGHPGRAVRDVQVTRAGGQGLLVFTNDIDELMVLCDRILAMVDGAVVGEYRAGGAEKNRILADILGTRERAATHGRAAPLSWVS